MRRATVTIAPELEAPLEAFLAAQPARPSLASVVEAALGAYLNEPPAAPSRLPLVMRSRDRIVAIASVHGAARIALFGSVANGTDGPDSDVDFWVEPSSTMGLFEIVALRHDLSEMLGAPVDVVTLGGLEERERKLVASRSLVL